MGEGSIWGPQQIQLTVREVSGRETRQHDLSWSAGWTSAGLSSTQVMARSGEIVLEIPSAGGRPANMAKAQLY